MKISYLLSLLLIITLLTSCEKDIIIQEPYYPRDNHQLYIESLRALGLDNSKLYKKWKKASQMSFDNPVTIRPPFQEIILFKGEEPDAHGYQFDLKKGERLVVDLDRISGDSGLLFIDLFRVTGDSLSMYQHIASQDSVYQRMNLEVGQDMTVLLRVQSELLHDVQCKIQIIKGPSLEFPVAGKGREAIGSLFGVPRDAGRRVHEGIDIFARRHTPIVSVSDGKVTFAGVKEGSLGGKVIWVKDQKRDLVVYYAHLEDVFVDQDEYVQRGDTIGSVGNSGNASTTYPHLHFGIYKNGAVDPYSFVVNNKLKPAGILSDTALIGQSMRLSNMESINSNRYSRSMLPELANKDYCEVIGATSTYYKIKNGKGQKSYVFYDYLDDLNKSIERIILDKDVYLFQKSDLSSIPLHAVKRSTQLRVLAYDDDYAYCQGDNDIRGWLALKQ